VKFNLIILICIFCHFFAQKNIVALKCSGKVRLKTTHGCQIDFGRTWKQAVNNRMSSITCLNRASYGRWTKRVKWYSEI